MEQEIYESKTIGLELIEQLKSCEKELLEITEYSKNLEKENNGAKEKIIEMNEYINQLEKSQEIYIPKKHDKIDERLGEFINRYPDRDRLNILFLRESEGVYQFGKKRVYVKVEQGNQVLVKVGGGFMNVKEFIEQYTA